jgi:magnesium chelatase family protein
MTIVGLPDTAVGESRNRARAAVVNSECTWPNHKITVALLPTDVHKRGSGLDLAVAIAVLAATDQVPSAAAAAHVILGELSLDGRVRPVRGCIAMALAARRESRGEPVRLIVPRVNAAEAALIPGVAVIPVDSLSHVVALLRGVGVPETVDVPAAVSVPRDAPDLADVRGQSEARWALEVAAAGGHNLAMVGMPGVGKTLLAERLPGLLPDLDDEAALEVTSIRSAFGLLPVCDGLVRRPPFEAPHHTVSEVALVGGGSLSRIRPGLVTLAHRGVLFLDEAPEFDRSALEAMRQSLESGTAAIARSGIAVRLPARFQLVLAANPCPCGLGQGRADRCTCTSLERRRYAARLSGPLMDRFDLRIVLEPPGAATVADDFGEPTALVRERVAAARERARTRLSSDGYLCNADVPGPVLRRRWPAAAGGMAVVRRALLTQQVTLRGADRILRVAWTLADLAGLDQPDEDQVTAAWTLRGDATAWAA